MLRYGLPVYCPLRLTDEDPNNGSIDKLKVIFNDCLRLLTKRKRQDHGRISDMLEELGWLSINQLCAETRLVEAWKTTHQVSYCMKDILHVKEKNQHIHTRSNDHTLLETGPRNKFANGSFVQKTAQIWNMAPRKVKDATTMFQAKRAIREYVKTLPL